MNWRIKAQILNVIAKFPYSEIIYPFFQFHFGRLSGDPYCRFQIALDFLNILKKNELYINNKTLL